MKLETAVVNHLLKSMPQEKIEALIEESDDERYQTLLRLFHDPAFMQLPLRQLIKMAGVTFSELRELYLDGQRSIAMTELADHLPDIVKDVAIDARSTVDSCPRCDGLLVIRNMDNTSTRPCPSCRGTGEVRRSGDKHARDLVFESAKLTGRSGPLVAIQTNVYGGDERMESMLKRTRQIVLDNKE